jgi:hypothetical protein
MRVEVRRPCRLARPRQRRAEPVGAEPGEHLAGVVAVIARHELDDLVEEHVGDVDPPLEVTLAPTPALGPAVKVRRPL